MPDVSLTDDEVALLAELLDQTLADMRYEIADTDNSRFRDEMRERYARIEAIAAKLGRPAGG